MSAPLKRWIAAFLANAAGLSGHCGRPWDANVIEWKLASLFKPSLGFFLLKDSRVWVAAAITAAVQRKPEKTEKKQERDNDSKPSQKEERTTSGWAYVRTQPIGLYDKWT